MAEVPPADSTSLLGNLPDITLSLPMQDGAQLTFVVIGLALLLLGWIIFRAGTRLLAIGLGAGFGFFLGEVLNVLLKVDRNIGLMITIGFSAVGGLGALIMIKAVTNFLFAIIGLLFGALLGRLGAEVHAAYNHTEFVFSKEAGIAILGVGFVTAIAAIWLQRFIMILITSYMGATFLVAGVDYLQMYPWAFPAVLAAGVIWQTFVLGRIFTTRRHRKPSDRDLSESDS